MKLLACLLLLSPIAAQTGAWAPPIAAPRAAKPADDRTPPAWVASVRAEVAAAVAEAMREALTPVVAALKEKATERPASMPAPVVVAPPASPAQPSPPGWIDWNVVLAIFGPIALAVAAWITKRIAVSEAVTQAKTEVRIERGAPKSEVAEGLRQAGIAPGPVAYSHTLAPPPGYPWPITGGTAGAPGPT